MIIKKNTICYTSEIGHNNFWYPTAERVMVKEECSAQQLPWINGSNTKIPIKILKSCLLPIDISENTTHNSSPPSKNEYTIVWIEKK
jgi:hypothetical protein